MSRIVGGKTVTCHQRDTDRYGRAMARSWVGDEDVDGAMVAPAGMRADRVDRLEDGPLSHGDPTYFSSSKASSAPSRKSIVSAYSCGALFSMLTKCVPSPITTYRLVSEPSSP